MLTLIHNARLSGVEAPQNLLIGAGKILGISPDKFDVAGADTTEIDLQGRTLSPGFVDNHVHILGGGGGLGYSSRAPEIQASQLTRSGITTVIGMLGFDATSRSMANLVGKTKALREDGVSAYCLTGATLEHPVPTLTGRIRTDIAFVDEIIGVGELSISELGYGYDSYEKGAQYVAEAATAGLLAGRLARKSGYVCLQVPPYRKTVLKPMFEVVDRTGLPITQFIPSHVNQTEEYLSDAIAWAKKGGWVDVGANYSPENNYSRAILPDEAIMRMLDAGVPLASILVSSDGNGAPPKEEKGEGRPRTANYMPVSAMPKLFRKLIHVHGMKVDDALSMFTSNVARACGLLQKGGIAVGMDADLIVFGADYTIDDVFCMGRLVVKDGAPIHRGMFEETILSELRDA
jgi:beta-aspartyl-dipeptidase (metallo-type)